MGLRRAALALALLAPGVGLRPEDCNRNAIEDTADIAEGRSGDCNRNGVPDECDTLPAALELPATVPLEKPPTAIAVADFDGDRVSDVAAVIAGGIVLFQGDGRGGFRALRTEPLAADVAAVLAADVDGNGAEDIVIADARQDVHGRGALHLLENDGAGRFLPARTTEVPPGPAAIAATDLDQDGDLDLSLACEDAGGVAILRGDGNGSFAAAPFLATEGRPTLIAVGDIDGDRRVDVLAADRAGTLFLFLQRDAGEMEASTVPLSLPCDAFALADLDADGDPDVLLSEPLGDGSGRLTILENDGKGRLAAGSSRALPVSPRALTVTDLDRDGRADVIAVDELTSSITVRLGRESVVDSLVRGYATGPAPREAVVADIDRDGDPDLILREAGGLSVLRNDGSGRLEAPSSLHLGPGVATATSIESLRHGKRALDFDQDGRPDLAITHSALGVGGACTVIFGGPGGSPDAVTTFPTGAGWSTAVAADLDGDGLPDLAVANGGTSGLQPGLSLHRNAGRRNFVPADRLSPGASMHSLIAGDFDQDGDVDLASEGAYLSLWENQGDGSFPRRRQIDGTEGVYDIVAADLDSDGDLDLAAALPDSKISILENLGRGVFAEARAIEAGDAQGPLAAADLDADGAEDLVFGRNRALILWNRGKAAFEREEYPVAGYRIQSMAPADVDGDGDLDLAVAGFENEPIEILVNRGRRRLQPLPPIQRPGRVISLGAADLDADGRAEILASRPIDGTLLVLRARGLDASPDWNGNRVPDECEGTLFIRGDPGGDGKVGISDALFVLLHLFRGGPAPPCEASADADGDGALLLGDAVRLLDYLFRSGPEPPLPFPHCGALDPGEALPCVEYPPCAR